MASGLDNDNSGIALIESIKAGAQSPPPGIRTLGLDRGPDWITSIKPGEVSARWSVDPAYFNLEDSVLAGWIACLADQSAFYAANTLMKHGQLSRLTRLELEYLEPITDGVVDFTGIAHWEEPKTIRSEAIFQVGTNVVARSHATIDVIQS